MNGILSGPIRAAIEPTIQAIDPGGSMPMA